jgi:uncharacterized membrane protein
MAFSRSKRLPNGESFMVDVLVPLGVIGWMAVMVGMIVRLFSNISLNRTIREALRSSPDSVSVLAQRLDSRHPWENELIGWVFIAFAVGMVLVGLLEGAQRSRETFEVAIIPGLAGVVVLFFVRIAKRGNKGE